MTFQRIAVVGAGQMGQGIAQVMAQHVEAVVMLQDIAPDALKKAEAGIQDSLSRLVRKDKLDAAARETALSRLQFCSDLNALTEADLVVEAIVESEEAKKQLFQKLDLLLSPSALLASNTSSISITRLARVTARPDHVIGMHFMNPVPLMQLVEVIRGAQTSDETCAQIITLTGILGKTPVLSRDFPGFIANRVLMPMINEAVFALYEGIASAQDIDAVMTLGMNHPMGPLTLADFIGLDTCLSIMNVLHEGFQDARFRPCPLLKQYVDAGYLGKKSGKGFFDYEP